MGCDEGAVVCDEAEIACEPKFAELVAAELAVFAYTAELVGDTAGLITPGDEAELAIFANPAELVGDIAGLTTPRDETELATTGDEAELATTGIESAEVPGVFELTGDAWDEERVGVEAKKEDERAVVGDRLPEVALPEVAAEAD